KQSVIPAVTHVDGTGRLQTVDRGVNPLYWELISAFETETGVPVILNTSFNENEPVVCTPDEALDCFFKTRMDLIVLGNFMVRRPDHESPELERPGARVGRVDEASLEESGLDGSALEAAGLETSRTARAVGAQP
ncbi:MAG: hypothetical protein LC772_01665, partial [Chloroflexi bacterium]|nr:hypothetical protein [Chloroflexota bacterium]